MQNFVDPAILFFVFGVLAGALKSNLEVPKSIAKFLSLYLLMALGLKGGFALAQSGFTVTIALSLGAALIMAFIVPAIGYAFLKNRVSRFDAAAVAAAYGSVSAVTFVTAIQFLETAGLSPGGHMAVAMVIMESPAIIMAVLLANSIRHMQAWRCDGAAAGTGCSAPSLGKILHESFTDGAHLLLLGSMAVGFISGEAGKSDDAALLGRSVQGHARLLPARHGPDGGEELPRRRQGLARPYRLCGGRAPSSMRAWRSGCRCCSACRWRMRILMLDAPPTRGACRAALCDPGGNPAIYFGLSLGVTFPLTPRHPTHHRSGRWQALGRCFRCWQRTRCPASSAGDGESGGG